MTDVIIQLHGNSRIHRLKRMNHLNDTDLGSVKTTILSVLSLKKAIS
jgi:hypothetical protein